MELGVLNYAEPYLLAYLNAMSVVLCGFTIIKHDISYIGKQ